MRKLSGVVRNDPWDEKVPVDFCRVEEFFLPRKALDAYRAYKASAEQRSETQVAPEKTPTPPSAPESVEPQATGGREIPVFARDDLAREKTRRAKDQAVARLLLEAALNGGRRSVPEWADLREKMCAIRLEFPNFSDMLEALECDLTLASVAQPEDFRVAPVLLYGAPGIGKTYMAACLAKSLGLSFAKVTASGAQAGFTFVGTASHWSNSHPGRIFELLAGSDSACAVLLIDEVDKFQQDARHPVIPALLDLLEGETARRFRDECVGMDIDASKLIVILTANDLAPISPPLLSRVQAFEITTPDTAQRAAIIRRQVEALKKATGQEVELSDGDCERLASHSSLDLRELQRLVRRAFGLAISQGAHRLHLDVPLSAPRQRFGFL